MVEAGETEIVAVAGGEHSLVREECERVGADELAHLIHVITVADKFLRRMYIYTIITCVLQRSTCDSYVNLGCTCLTKHLHDLERSRTTDDGVIHEHYPLSFHDRPYRRELHLHTLLTERLGRKDECTADVLVLDKSHLVRKSAGLGITLRSRKAGIRHTYYNVSLDRRLLVEDPS